MNITCDKKKNEALYKINASWCYCYQKAGQGNYCLQFLSVSVCPHISMSLCQSKSTYGNWKRCLNEIFSKMRMPQYSWNTAKIGIKDQSINQRW